MKPAAAWTLFALISIATAVYFIFSQRYFEPPAEFAALELAKADFDNTGSCFSLHNVLAGNDLTAESPDQSVLWTLRVKDEWHLRVTRGRTWREYWFVRAGDRILPMQYVVENGQDGKPVQQAIDELLAAPRMTSMPRLARCEAAH